MVTRAMTLLMLLLLQGSAVSAQAPIRLQFGERDVDVDNRTLSFRMNSVAAEVELTITSPEG